MTRARGSFPVLMAAVALVGLVSGCGPKRPPASTTGSGAHPRTTTSSGSDTAVDGGPELRPLDSDSASGADMTYSDSSGEGGPLSDVYFEYDQSALTDATRATLAQHATWIKAHAGARIAVEGHCDERGTTEYNLALGDQRAQATRDYLVSLGVPKDRLAAISLGKERPVDPGHTESAWAKNRRAHFRVTR
jgi:peptidoglycan-associated lipoprotein